MAALGEGQGAEIEVSASPDGEGARVVSLRGELDASNVEEVRSLVDAVAGERPEKLVFDVEALTFIDSAGIAVLIGAASTAGSVHLRGASPIVRRVIELSGLTEVLRLLP